jgi:two-component system CheB/CheR fusion protein
LAPRENHEGSLFPIVGIGASAGGLAAFEAFFSGLPADVDPGHGLCAGAAPGAGPQKHPGRTDPALHPHAGLRSREDGMVVRPNCAYIIPPNHDMAFLNGTLQLLEPTAPRGQRLPIDFFFRSLAQDQHERAIGIVLSGTGSDGTLGVRAIKGEGGMVMAQNPDPPSSTACRAAPSPPVWSITSCRRPKCRPS